MHGLSMAQDFIDVGLRVFECCFKVDLFLLEILNAVVVFLNLGFQGLLDLPQVVFHKPCIS